MMRSGNIHTNGRGAGFVRCRLPIIVFVALTVLAVPAAVPPSSAAADYLTASGCSISNLGYLTELAKEYERRTGVRIFVRGGGSVVGIEDLRSGTVDFAASCRSKEAGDPGDIEFIQVAWDALVFVVHPSNPVHNLTLDQARAIYSGTIRDWRELGGRAAPIAVFISRSKRGLSGVEASTKALVLGGAEPKETRNTHFAASTGIVEQMVEETANGFATTGYTSARKRRLKMLSVNGVMPSNKAIVSGRYPLKRPLFLLVPRSAKPEVRRFVEFTLGREGQRYLRSLNVVSLLDVK